MFENLLSLCIGFEFNDHLSLNALVLYD